MEKTSKIIKCTYDKPWTAPSGDVIYWHFLELANGDHGKVATAEISPPKIAVGSEISYIQEAPGKNFKLVAFVTHDQQEVKKVAEAPKAPAKSSYAKSTGSPKGQNGPTWQNSKIYRKNPEDYLGFVFGYAKDVVIAQINNGDKKAMAKPTDAVNKMAEEFYDKVKQLLQGEPDNTNIPQ